MSEGNNHFKTRRTRRSLQLWSPEDEGSVTPTWELKVSQRTGLTPKKTGAKGRKSRDDLAIYFSMQWDIDTGHAKNPHDAAIFYASRHPEWNGGSARNVNLALNVYRKVKARIGERRLANTSRK